MAICHNSLWSVKVLQKYQQILRGYSTTKRAERIAAAASAYEVLGLPRNCSATSIRAAFRKLAKATHPDLQSETSTVEFIRVLAAYEILSDPQKRAQYDENLRCKRMEQSRSSSSGFQEASCEDGRNEVESDAYDEQELGTRTTEVVSWLRRYRAMVKDIIRRQEIGVGRGWEEDLRAETQSALKKAYFGPPVSEREGLPECFEAEERAQPDFWDVLHLVSGRQQFGLVREVQTPQIEGSHEYLSMLHTTTDFIEKNDDLQDQSAKKRKTDINTSSSPVPPLAERSDNSVKEDMETAFVDLELQMFGSVVARSIRVPHDESFSDASISGSIEGHDSIYVYLSSELFDEEIGPSSDGTRDFVKRIFLGSIRGLGSSKVGHVCDVYGPDGKKTHLILQHRTPMVKHLQWFRVGSDTSPCECRCRRARVLPSRYWIFEPRAETHNVGGWYIETFGQNRQSWKRRLKNRDAYQSEEHEHRMFSAAVGNEKMLHPAMYILAAAYKTLDEEASRRKTGSISTRLKTWTGLQKLSSSLSVWWGRRWFGSKFV